MGQQQAQHMAEVAKDYAIRNLAKNSNMNHADLSEKAQATTRSVGVQNGSETKSTCSKYSIYTRRRDKPRDATF
eukprot:5795691-Alexandrium_andersonii.AAC.1